MKIKYDKLNRARVFAKMKHDVSQMYKKYKFKDDKRYNTTIRVIVEKGKIV